MRPALLVLLLAIWTQSAPVWAQEARVPGVIPPGSVVPLEGTWELVPGYFTMSGPTPARAPGIRQGVRRDEPPAIAVTMPFDPALVTDRFGYGTLRTQVNIVGEGPFYLRIPEIPSSWRLWVDGRLRGSAGQIGTTAETSEPQHLIDYYELGTREGEYSIVIEYANFDSWRAAILQSPEIADRAGFSRRFFVQNVIPLVINGIFLFLAVYYLILFLMDRRNEEHLFFALFVFSLMARQILIGQEISSAALAGLGIGWRISYAVWYAMIPVQLFAFDQYARSVFPDEASVHFSRALGVFTLVYAVFCLVAPGPLFTRTLPLVQAIAVIFGVYIHVVIVRAIIHRRERAWLLAASSIVLFAAVINDVLFSLGVVQTGRLLNVGALLFVLIQAALLSGRYATTVRDLVGLTERLKAINAVYTRFVPADLPRILNVESTADVGPGDFRSRVMCAMVLDVRDFTSMSEAMEPDENFSFINDFLARSAPLIRAGGGFITGFAGDQIRALFDDASHAVEASIRIHRTLAGANARAASEGRPEVHVGIGLAWGRVLVGAVGSDSRLQLAALSPAVTRAERLESLTRATDSLILCDEEVMRHASESARLSSRRLGVITGSGDGGSGTSGDGGAGVASGTGERTALYELIYRFMPREQVSKLETRHLFERALSYLVQGEDERAMTNLRIVAEENPADVMAAHYLATRPDEMRAGIVYG